MGSGQFLDPGANPGALKWEHRVLAPGPPGKAQLRAFFASNPLLILLDPDFQELNGDIMLEVSDKAGMNS